MTVTEKRLPISTVEIGMWKSDGTPSATITSAVCDICGEWATGLWVAGSTVADTPAFNDVRVSRRTQIVIYTCPEHSDEVATIATAQHGGCSNAYTPDALAMEVGRSQSARFQQERE